MSSAEVTTSDDACKRLNFPLPIELRMKIYEELLVRRDGSLKPNGVPQIERPFDPREKDKTFISILLTCRTIYEEALPFLYGKNVIVFHDAQVRKPVLPFPERHLIMIKHVEVETSPYVYGSVEDMGNLLMTLGTSGAKPIDVSVRIYMTRHHLHFYRGYRSVLPLLRSHDALLSNENPVIVGLLSLKAVKKLDIRVEGEVRFQPGVACALRTSFMEKGTAIDRSIAIRKACTSPIHRKFGLKEPCFLCGTMKEGLITGIGYYDYRDDKLTWRLLRKFNEHTELERRNALERIRRQLEAKES